MQPAPTGLARRFFTKGVAVTRKDGEPFTPKIPKRFHWTWNPCVRSIKSIVVNKKTHQLSAILKNHKSRVALDQLVALPQVEHIVKSAMLTTLATLKQHATRHVPFVVIEVGETTKLFLVHKKQLIEFKRPVTPISPVAPTYPFVENRSPFNEYIPAHVGSIFLAIPTISLTQSRMVLRNLQVESQTYSLVSKQFPIFPLPNPIRTKTTPGVTTPFDPFEL